MGSAETLEGTARVLVAPGKGILAADESSPTIAKRFAAIGVESVEETRRFYRELLFSTEGCEEFLSGAILYEETLRQSTSQGTPFPDLLAAKGILPGIKVDGGAKPLAGAPGEKVTAGLDGLRERLLEYRERGARFAKWRAVIAIAPGLPSDLCIEVNAHALARYAALCVEAELVPIVEPEVLMDGDHTIEVAGAVTERVLGAVFQSLSRHRVAPEQILLKPNMVLSGYACSQRAGIREVAQRTLRCLHRAVPSAVPGIVFLSGGQTDEDATAHLNEMNRIGGAPWELSFSYGRALQQPALRCWSGRAENRDAAQRAFYRRAKLNGAARSGGYSATMEKAA